MKRVFSGTLLMLLLANVSCSAFKVDLTINQEKLETQIEMNIVFFPSNGHYYQVIAVETYVTWAQAKIQAESLDLSGINGHLATITSMAENDFIINNLGGPTVLNRYWLGGFQPSGSPEPAGNWRWVTEEPWNFTNWAAGEPSNHYGGEYGGAPAGSDEEVLHFFRNNGQWNDMEETSFQPGFIVEYESAQELWQDSFDDTSKIELKNNLTIDEGSAGLSTFPIHAGNDPVSSNDGYYLVNGWTDMDMTNPVSNSGRLTQWQVYALSSGSVRLKVFRNNSTHLVFIGETPLQTFGAGLNTFSCNIDVNRGDVIGTYLQTGKLDVWVTGTPGYEIGHVGDINATLPLSQWEIWNDTLPLHATGFAYESKGSLTSIQIQPQSIDEWRTLTINKTEPPNASITVSVLDGLTNATILGFENMTGSIVDLSMINASIHPTLRLRGDFQGTPYVSPLLHDWSVEWGVRQLSELDVYVVNSCNSPIANALVEVANLTAYSNGSGRSIFDLPYGTYNVSAAHSDYNSASWVVDVDRDKNVTLTLAYPYVFEGEISNSTIIITPVQSGYNITLFNNLTSSDMDVFFDWINMGTISPGTWRVFTFDHLPNLIVEAASKGSTDYPKAWYKHPLPIQLVPATGSEGAFLTEPVPYAAASIFVIPYPPVQGQDTTIGVTLHNPYEYILNISRVDFQISGLTVGGYFTSVGYLCDISLQANETRVFSVKWNTTVTGHHCVRVVLTFSPTTQTVQRNIDIEYAVIQGQRGEVSFSLVNPFQTSKEMTLTINKQLLASEAILEIEGRVYDTSSDIVIEVAPGQVLHTTLRIETSSTAFEDGAVNIEAYIDGQLIGGLRKEIKTVPITYPQYCEYYLAYPNGERISDQIAEIGRPFKVVVVIKNPDVVSHDYTIDLAQTSVSTPMGAVVWNWEEPIKTVIDVLGFPVQWPANPVWNWLGESQKTKTVPPDAEAKFVYEVGCSWDWIPPWDWKYILGTIFWAIRPGTIVTQRIGDIITWTEPLGLLDQLQGIGSFIQDEVFGFDVSYGSTVLDKGGARVTVPYLSPKMLCYVASLLLGVAAAGETAWALGTTLSGVGAILAVALFLFEGGTIIGQNYIYDRAADPASDYTQVVQPTPVTLLNGTRMMDLPAVISLDESTYGAMQAFASYLEYENVTSISANRYMTARAADDQYYQNLQLQAVTTYACHRDMSLASFEDQLSPPDLIAPAIELNNNR